MRGKGKGERGKGVYDYHSPNRILVMRLDRMGDVVLSTPALQELRKAYPDAFIAMMVKKQWIELIEANPYINEAIWYDKDVGHHGWLSTARFALGLLKYKFDTAIVLHPTNRSHWIAFLSGARTRIGWDKKSGWLLTNRVRHMKQLGEKHEAEYTLELIGELGIKPGKPSPFVPVNPKSDERLSRLLVQNGASPTEAIIAIHPSASDETKRWMSERFAKVADVLIERHGARIVLVASKDDSVHSKAVADAMKSKPIDLSGKLTPGELACLFKRCRLLISNDSGPVHVAAAVGTPVISIFGRNQAGLGHKRWGPIGEGHIILHKEVGGDIDRRTLEELKVEEVLAAAEKILNQRG